MAYENEFSKSQEPGVIEDQKPHTSWFNAVIDRIQELDTEFPLSGGEDGHPHIVHRNHRAPVKPVAVKQPEPIVTTEPHHHSTWFGRLIEKIQDLDVDFPLSGGEPQRHHIHNN